MRLAFPAGFDLTRDCLLLQGEGAGERAARDPDREGSRLLGFQSATTRDEKSAENQFSFPLDTIPTSWYVSFIKLEWCS